MMKKMIAGLFVLAAVLFANSAFAGDVDTKTVVLSGLTTNATTDVLGIAGELALIQVVPDDGEDIDITITESFTGATVYTKEGVTNSVTLSPVTVMTKSDGTDVTFDGTNKAYKAWTVAGLNFSAVTDSTNAPSVTVKVLYDKKR